MQVRVSAPGDQPAPASAAPHDPSPRREMDGRAGQENLPRDYLVLLIILTIPFYLLGGRRLPVGVRLPASALMFLASFAAALITAHRYGGIHGVGDLLKRALDYRKVKSKAWFVPALFLGPAVYFLAYWVMRWLGRPLPDPQFSWVAALPYLAMFLVEAPLEELAWQGLLVDPLQKRWGALAAGLMVGSAWQIWHLIPLIQVGNSPGWILWHVLEGVALRVLMVWIYNNGGRSVLTAIVVHVTVNLSWSLFPVNGSHYDPFFTSLLMWLAAGIVTFTWGPATLASFRFGHARRVAREPAEGARKCTAFVLSGGGSRGSLQVGAMRALLEAGIVPDLLVGSSIGAVNATGLALWGVSLQGISALEQAWGKMAGAQVLDKRMSRLALRIMLGRPSGRARKMAEDFAASIGLTYDLRFGQIRGVRLALISADIQTGQPVIYGQNTDDSVLEGLLASIALPPWFAPQSKDGRLMIDGGALSNLAIEPAMQLGATEIIALDLNDSATVPGKDLTFRQYFEKYIFALNRRHACLERSLAEARGIAVRYIDFRGLAASQIWDFSNYQALIRAGYDRAREEIAAWSASDRADSSTAHDRACSQIHASDVQDDARR